MTQKFDLFVAVDWSGAKGRRQQGIAIAACESGNGFPQIIKPEEGGFWSREAAIRKVNQLGFEKTILCGFDFAFASPYMDKRFYFPNPPISANRATELWSQVEAICTNDTDLYAGSFFEHQNLRELFHTETKKGELFEYRLRVCEAECIRQNLGAASSFFLLIGSAQVGKGSLSGMRGLLKLPSFSIWPISDLKAFQSVAVEIYPRVFKTLGGLPKNQPISRDSFESILGNLGSNLRRPDNSLNPHEIDAVISAAGLRRYAGEEKYWKPKMLDSNVGQIEGWIFGVL